MISVLQLSICSTIHINNFQVTMFYRLTVLTNMCEALAEPLMQVRIG